MPEQNTLLEQLQAIDATPAILYSWGTLTLSSCVADTHPLEPLSYASDPVRRVETDAPKTPPELQAIDIYVVGDHEVQADELPPYSRELGRLVVMVSVPAGENPMAAEETEATMRQRSEYMARYMAAAAEDIVQAGLLSAIAAMTRKKRHRTALKDTVVTLAGGSIGPFGSLMVYHHFTLPGIATGILGVGLVQAQSYNNRENARDTAQRTAQSIAGGIAADIKTTYIPPLASNEPG